MSSKLAITDQLPLPQSSVRIPRLGFGVYQAHADECIQSTLTALKTGYRHIDTAQFYGNEKEVGEAVRQSGLPREDVFITTKIMSPAGSPQATYEKVVESVDRITGDYCSSNDKNGFVDLFLIHSPRSGAAGRKELWQALERLLDEGRTRSIGVSNYGIQHLEEMKSYAKVWPPHVNQIEVNYPASFFLYFNVVFMHIYMYMRVFTRLTTLIASPLVPTARDCPVLPTTRYRRRSILPAGPRQQVQRSHAGIHSSEIRTDHRSDSRPIQSTKELGATTQELQTRPHCQ